MNDNQESESSNDVASQHSNPSEIDDKPLNAKSGGKPFQCDLCPRSFALKNSLNTHMKVHSVKNPFICELCQHAFGHKSTLAIHMRSHSGEKPYVCDVCNYSTAYKSSLECHMRNHTGDKPFVCNVCLCSFVRKSILLRHMRTHSRDKPFNCDMCDYSTVHKVCLQRHLKVHSGEKPFNCEVCNASFARRSNYRRHKKVHTGENDFFCEECESSFGRQSDLVAHKKALHSGETPGPPEADVNSLSKKKKSVRNLSYHKGQKTFDCHICHSSFVSKEFLMKHMRIHQKAKGSSVDISAPPVKNNIVDEDKILQERKLFKCEVCQLIFASKEILIVHKKTHFDDKVNIPKEPQFHSTYGNYLMNKWGDDSPSCAESDAKGEDEDAEFEYKLEQAFNLDNHPPVQESGEESKVIIKTEIKQEPQDDADYLQFNESHYHEHEKELMLKTEIKEEPQDDDVQRWTVNYSQ